LLSLSGIQRGSKSCGRLYLHYRWWLHRI
jgi:hypothetical protein